MPLLVWYTGTTPPAPAFSSDGETVFNFHGGQKTYVHTDADMAKYRFKAKKSPDKWHVEETAVVPSAKRIKSVLSFGK